MQIKLTTVVVGKSYESTIAAPGAPADTPAEQVSFVSNSAILQAVSGAINLHQGSRIDSIKVEVVG